MENNDILRIALRSSDIPPSWPYCFISSCPQHGQCLRYQAALTLDSSTKSGQSVYPATATPEGCPLFKPVRTIRTAWGFTSLFRDVRAIDAPLLRKNMRNILGGNGTYYRYHHGARRLSPEQQATIRMLFADFGYESVEFDHYQLEIDF